MTEQERIAELKVKATHRIAAYLDSIVENVRNGDAPDTYVQAEYILAEIEQLARDIDAGYTRRSETEGEKVNNIAEIVAEIWRSGKLDSKVFDFHECMFDFHECSSRKRWVARLVSLLSPVPELTLIETIPTQVDIERYWYGKGAVDQLAHDQQIIKGDKE